MELQKLDIHGAYVVNQERKQDDRGYFSRLFCINTLQKHGIYFPISQINKSLTKHVGSLRGLHFQHPPKAEMKMVQCLNGAIVDVIADLRADSPTFLKWQSVTLNDTDAKALCIPKGCAHGFQTLEPNTELLYFHSVPYSPEHDDGIRYDEPLLNVSWPLPVSDISLKDKRRPHLPPEFSGLQITD